MGGYIFPILLIDNIRSIGGGVRYMRTIEAKDSIKLLGGVVWGAYTTPP
mgnify:FL=1